MRPARFTGLPVHSLGFEPQAILAVKGRQQTVKVYELLALS